MICICVSHYVNIIRDVQDEDEEEDAVAEKVAKGKQDSAVAARRKRKAKEEEDTGESSSEDSTSDNSTTDDSSSDDDSLNKCKKCGEGFKWPSGLSRHFVQNKKCNPNAKPKIWRCSAKDCKKVSKNWSDSNRHMVSRHAQGTYSLHPPVAKKAKKAPKVKTATKAPKAKKAKKGKK